MSERLPGPLRRTAMALARAALPGGRWLPPAEEHVVGRAAALVAGSAPARSGVGAAFAAFEVASMPWHRWRSFSRLARDDAERFVGRWLEGSLRSAACCCCGVAAQAGLFRRPGVYERLGATYCFSAAGDGAAPARPWMRQVLRAAEVRDDVLECDVVVVGTGAGGAVVAKELAERGHRVLMLEEGELQGRASFDGRPLESVQRLYQQRGRIVAVGNCAI